MMFGILREIASGEHRVSLVPTAASRLVKDGHAVMVEHDAGRSAGFPDETYTAAGCMVASRTDVLHQCSVILAVAVPVPEVVAALQPHHTLVSMLYPRRHPDVVQALAARGTSCFAMDAMPRTTRAQSMDVLSSQNNLAGYKAVIVGANALGKIFPLMMTAAGTVAPARVLVYGAGVAGLQAIATARRLGAIVEVTDVRPETREQVESLGGKFIAVPGLEDVKVQGGYVAELGADLLARQQEAVEKSLLAADLVVLTALVQGGSAPVLVTASQVERMKPGAVIVDLAAEAGGNCELTSGADVVVRNGVTVIGCPNLAAGVPTHASELYAKNMVAFLQHIATEIGLRYDVTDDIIASTLVVHNGTVRV